MQMECELTASHSLMGDVPNRCDVVIAIEVGVLRVHVHECIRMAGYANRVDPDR